MKAKHRCALALLNRCLVAGAAAGMVSCATLPPATVIDPLELSRGTVILSGFIARDTDEVSNAARAVGLLPDRIEGEAEWRCLVARAPRGAQR